jgi:hypothetical protein
MGILETLGTGQGYLKAGFLGFPKSGKTWTAMLLACGVREFFGLDGPIAMYDTEGGSEYIAEEIRRRTGMPPLGLRSRKFDDLMEIGRECETSKISVLLVDSITHPWRELCDSYLKQVNERRKEKKLPAQLRLEFQDWNKIKPKWATWTDFYLNSRLHIVLCGRAGYEYDMEERDDESGKKDLVKTGIKMKTEGEFGFEPSLLVQMERIQLREDGRLTPGFTHHATIIGDRFNAIDGAEADNPGFDFFKPHVAMLKAGVHAPIATGAQSDFGLDADGDDGATRERKLRVILAEKIQAAMVLRWPGQTAKEKQAKARVLNEAFGTTSWTEVETRLSAEDLRRGLEMIQNNYAAAAPTEEVA